MSQPNNIGPTTQGLTATSSGIRQPVDSHASAQPSLGLKVSNQEGGGIRQTTPIAINPLPAAEQQPPFAAPIATSRQSPPIARRRRSINAPVRTTDCHPVQIAPALCANPTWPHGPTNTGLPAAPANPSTPTPRPAFPCPPTATDQQSWRRPAIDPTSPRRRRTTSFPPANCHRSLAGGGAKMPPPAPLI